MSKLIGTKIPNSGFVEKIYCNTEASCEEVNAILSKLTFVDHPVFQMPTYTLLANAEGKPLIVISITSNVYMVIMMSDLNDPAAEESPIYLYDPDDLGNSGWWIDTTDINADVVDNIFDLSVGAENELLSGILSISEFTTPPLKDVIKDIANSIREKDGSTDLIKMLDMPDKIRQIPSSTKLKYKKDVVGIEFNKELSKESIYSRLASLTYSPDSSLTNNFNGLQTNSYLIAWGSQSETEQGRYMWFKAFQISKDIIHKDRDEYGLTMSIVAPEIEEGAETIRVLYASDSEPDTGFWEGWETFYTSTFASNANFVGGVYAGLENDKLADLVSLIGEIEEEVQITTPGELNGNSLVISEPNARIDVKEMIAKGNLPTEVITNVPKPFIRYKRITSITMDTSSMIPEDVLSGLNYTDNFFYIFVTQYLRLFIQRVDVNNTWVYFLKYSKGRDEYRLYASAAVWGDPAGWTSGIGNKLEFENIDGKMDEEYVIFENPQAHILNPYVSYGTIAENIVLDKVYHGVDMTIRSNQTINIKDWFDKGWPLPIHIKIDVKASYYDMLQHIVDSSNSCRYLFYHYKGGNIDFIEKLDVENIEDMSYMFSQCNNLTSIPLLGTYKATDMSFMFDTCSSLSTIPALSTSRVTNMKGMFYGCTNLTTIPELDTSNVTTMQYMFESCTSLTTIPWLNTSKVTDMSYMFDNCTNLTTIPELATTKVTDMSYMFQNCTSLITTISWLNLFDVTNMSYMFNNCTSLTTVSQLSAIYNTNTNHMFNNCTSLTTVSQLDARNAEDMSFMFYKCINLTTVDPLDTSKATDMQYMFYNCYLLPKIDITRFNISSTYDSNSMFYNCHSLKQIIIRNFGYTTLNSNTFNNCYHLTGAVNSTYNPNGAKDCYIYVPRSKVDILKSATNWSTYASQIRALEDYTVDGTTTGDLDETKI